MEKETRNINGTIYYVYSLSWMCLPTANNFPCGDCKCFGGREGNNILCAIGWADKALFLTVEGFLLSIPRPKHHSKKHFLHLLSDFCTAADDFVVQLC